MSRPEPKAFVLFGATGDLAFRMILPSLYALDAEDLLPPDLVILGVARSALERAQFHERVVQSVHANTTLRPGHDEALRRFLGRVDYVSADATGGQGLRPLLAAIEGREAGALYYLATSPTLYGPICEALARSGLAECASGVVLEKPIGRDFASSRAINDAVAAAFNEERVFRVDHYLGKEMVQNLLALRFANALFEPLWNSENIEHVQITVAETIGVEGRWSYFDGMGTLRDMVQNHVLQLLCLIAMEPPSHFEPSAVRNEKVKVLRSLRPLSPTEVARRTVAGQYTRGAINGKPVVGYSEEPGGGPSNTETFVALRVDIENWRWAGVPFFLRTGKRLPERRTEVLMRFRNVPHNIFGSQGAILRQNTLRILLQPEEKIQLHVMNKEPGLDGMRLRPLTLDLSLTQAFQEYRQRIAYERLILDALKGATTLFVRRDEVEAAWEWIDGIIRGWELAGDPPRPYPAGTWGPAAAHALIERAGFSWVD